MLGRQAELERDPPVENLGSQRYSQRSRVENEPDPVVPAFVVPIRRKPRRMGQPLSYGAQVGQPPFAREPVPLLAQPFQTSYLVKSALPDVAGFVATLSPSATSYRRSIISICVITPATWTDRILRCWSAKKKQAMPQTSETATTAHAMTSACDSGVWGSAPKRMVTKVAIPAPRSNEAAV